MRKQSRREMGLRNAYKVSPSNFEDLLLKAKSVSIHEMNLQLLVTEISKLKGILTEVS